METLSAQQTISTTDRRPKLRISPALGGPLKPATQRPVREVTAAPTVNTKPGDKDSYIYANRVLVGNFLAAQTVIIREIIALGSPLIDFFSKAEFTRPQSPKVRTDPLPHNEGNRQGKFGWDQYRSLQILFLKTDKAAQSGDVVRFHSEMERIENFIKGFDFSLIERIYGFSERYTKSYWNRHHDLIEERNDERLRAEMRNARRIRDSILTANDKLVRNEVSKWCSRSVYNGDKHPDYMDLYQEGLIGLSNGIGKLSFETIDKGISLSTVVVKWIQHGIRRWHDKYGNTINVPSCKKQRIQMVRIARKKLQTENGVAPSVRQVAIACRLTEKQVIDVDSAISCGSVSSINTPLKDDEKGGELGDVLEVEDQNLGYRTEANVESRDLARMVAEILADLTPESRFILCAQNGIDGLPEASRDLIEEMLDQSRAKEMILLKSVSDQRLHTASIEFSEWPAELLA